MRYYASLALVLLAACSGSKDGGKVNSWEHPDEAFRIGRGYDAEAVEQIRGDCITNPEQFLNVTWRDAQGIRAELTETRVTTFEQLMKELSFSINASGRYTFYSGSASYSKYEKFNSSEENFTWIFGINAEVGSRTMKTETITAESFKPEAKALIEQARAGNSDAKRSFQRMCGTQFVRSVRLGGHISEVLEVSAKATNLIEEIHASVSAGGGAAVWSASGSASFNSVLERASRSSMLKREFSQHGGTRINYDMTPDNVQKTLDEFAHSLSRENATVLSIELVDWDTVVNFTPNGVTDMARRNRLEQLLKELWRHREKLDRIDSFIYWYEKGDVTLTPEEIAHLRESYAKVTTFIDQVTEVGQNCYVDGRSCGVALTPIVVNFPPIRSRDQVKSEFSTANWTFDYAGLRTNFHNATTGATQSWSSDDLLHTESIGNDQVDLRTDLIESSCTTISSVLSQQGPVVLTSFRGEPIHYVERVRDYPDGKHTVLSFGFKEGGQCLLLQVYTDRAISRGISLSDDSKAAQMARRMAQSVRSNN